MPPAIVSGMKGSKEVTSARIRAARIVAVAADFLQLAVVPAFAGGLASPVNDALDVAVAATMIVLVGWHWAFLPSFLSELIPFWDLVPTWTAAAFLATRRRRGEPEAAREAVETHLVSRTPPKNPSC